MKWTESIKHHSIRIKNLEAVKEKINTIVNDSVAHLHIISDFDMTLTKYWVNGQRGPSSHAVFKRSTHLSNDLQLESDKLYEKYYPMEISTALSIVEKTRAMVDWWTSAHELILRYKVNKEQIAQMVKETPMTFRELSREFIQLCYKKDIPLLVFSAGLADVILQIFLAENLWSSNMHLVSNKMKFDDNGTCIAFEDPLIHVFNKNEANIKGTPYYASVESRNNVIVLGDSIGDLKMSEGLKHHVTLTIGFLNHDTDEHLENYMNQFDVVITDDSSFAFVCDLLESIKI